MNKLYFATTNNAKVRSLIDAFGNSNIEITAVEIDIPEIRSEDVNKVASAKVLYAFEQMKKPMVAQDGGFFIHSLNGFPSTYVNFAVKTIGVEGILKLTEGKAKSAEFVDVFAYMDETLKEPRTFTSTIVGTLTDEPRGNITARNWGLLHLIFIPEGADKTFAEMDEAEMKTWLGGHFKNFCSKQFADWFTSKHKPAT